MTSMIKITTFMQEVIEIVRDYYEVELMKIHWTLVGL